MFAESGNIETTGETPTFVYRYTLVAFVMDFPGHIDELMLPLIVWLMHNQPDLLLNPEKTRTLSFPLPSMTTTAPTCYWRFPCASA